MLCSTFIEWSADLYSKLTTDPKISKCLPWCNEHILRSECTDVNDFFFILLCMKKKREWNKPGFQHTFKEKKYFPDFNLVIEIFIFPYRGSHFLFIQLNCKTWFLCQILCLWINVRISFGTSIAPYTKVYSIITCSQGLHTAAVSNILCFNLHFLDASKINIEQSHSILISINPDILRQANLLS